MHVKYDTAYYTNPWLTVLQKHVLTTSKDSGSISFIHRLAFHSFIV